MSTANLENNNLPNNNIIITGISKSALRWVAAMLSLILLSTIIGLSYSIGVEDAEQGAIPIIRADGSAVKIRPENPGGRQYPHQDLTIYNSFRDDIAPKEVQIKDTTEKPLDLYNLDTEKQTSNTLKQVIKDNDTTTLKNNNIDELDDIKLTTISKDNSTDLKKPSISKKIPKTSPEKTIKKIIAQPQKNKRAILTPSKKKTPVAKTQITKGAYLQIGAFRSKPDALSALKKAHSKFPELSSLGHFIVKADLGRKGIYYRLRVGPYKSKQASLQSCNHLKSKGQPCLYVLQ